MMHEIGKLLAERIQAGLKRKSLTTCSRWACECRVMGKPFPGNWSFRYHPWLREMHDSRAELNVGQKSAQVGFTETVLNKTFFKIDVEGVDCLYVLPAKTPDASDFSAARFDPALELSPHLSRLFSDVKNIGHKRAGTTNLYIRGSKSRAGLKSVPVGFVVLDEVDEMNQDNIPLAWERMSGQKEKEVWMVSTPTIDNFGINKYYQLSTQEHFCFKCPCCGKMTELTFPDCLVVTADDLTDPKVTESYIRCKECKNRLEHEEKPTWLKDGIWVPMFPERDTRGFHVNQLYSFTVPPKDLALSFLRAQRDPADEQEFYNSKLGLPHIVEGARITDADIDRCRGDYKKGARKTNRVITMGIDVGRWLHYEIDEWLIPNRLLSDDFNIQSRVRVIDQGKVLHFEQLDLLMKQFGVWFAVIDAQPDRRKSLEFALRFPGHVKMCFYGMGVQGKAIHVGKEEQPDVPTIEPTITVDRTSWLDLSLGRFRTQGMIELPVDITTEYREHLKALVRVYEKDRDGNPVGKYVKGSNADHYAHARNYAEIALNFAVSLSTPENIGSFM